jgi:hypothetical protein
MVGKAPESNLQAPEKNQISNSKRGAGEEGLTADHTDSAGAADGTGEPTIKPYFWRKRVLTADD